MQKELVKSQRNEITEHFIYKRLAESNKKNKITLKKISEDELKHYNIWKNYTKQEVKPSKFKISKYLLLSKLFGMTFALKLMERGESKAQISYEKIMVKESKRIIQDEIKHEKEIKGINSLNEESLKYTGSIVLGLSDALVELTGALAGFTFALQDSRLIVIAGLITGIAASLSMASTGYLVSKEEGTKKPIKSALITGLSYLLTVFLLIMPYILLKNMYLSLVWSLLNVVLIIFLFTYYSSVAKDYSFKKKFFGMALLSLSIAAISFGIGFIVRIVFGINV